MIKRSQAPTVDELLQIESLDRGAWICDSCNSVHFAVEGAGPPDDEDEEDDGD